jgi:DNA-binding response OmpR family regulator
MQTVLIAEDWATLRERLDDALNEAGYFTLAACTGQEALGLLRAVRADLLLARERLPDVEGSALAEILRRRGYEELVVVLLAEDGAAEEHAVERGSADALVPRALEVEPVVELVRHLLRPVICHSPPSAESGHTYATTVA